MRSAVRRWYQRAIAALLGLYGLAGRLWRRDGRLYVPDAVCRILVLRLGLMGDGAMLTPALYLLRERFPKAEIDVLATPIQASLFHPLPVVDRVITWTAGDLLEPRRALRLSAWPEAFQVVSRLRARRYDVALSCYGALGSALALLSGATYRFGYAGEALPGTLTHALPGRRFDQPWHDVEYNAAIARAAGAAEVTPPMTLVVEEPAKAAAAALLDGAASPLVVFHPGATNGEAKRWPAAYWVALGRLLLAGTCALEPASRRARAPDAGRGAVSAVPAGVTVVLVGGAEDRRLAADIAAAIGPGVVNLTGRTSIPELLAVIDRASVVVTGDSGPMHLAVARRRPVVAIHGPTDPRHQGPFDRSVATAIRRPLPCSPCYRLDRVADCPLGHTLCQWLVRPEAVYAAVRAYLKAERIDNVSESLCCPSRCPRSLTPDP